MKPNCIASRNTLMRAFAVAEMVTASLETTPASVTAAQSGGTEARVDVHFLNNPEAVRTAAAQYGVKPVVTPDYAGDPTRVGTEATAEHDGVTIRFWALVKVTEEAAA